MESIINPSNARSRIQIPRSCAAAILNHMSARHEAKKATRLSAGRPEVPSRIELLCTVLQTVASPLGHGTGLRVQRYVFSFLLANILTIFFHFLYFKPDKCGVCEF